MPQATSLAAELKQAFGTDPELVKLSGGVFEIYRDGELIFSKKQAGRFPKPGEVLARMQESSV